MLTTLLMGVIQYVLPVLITNIANHIATHGTPPTPQQVLDATPELQTAALEQAILAQGNAWTVAHPK
jgi:hypothetical protein